MPLPGLDDMLRCSKTSFTLLSVTGKNFFVRSAVDVTDSSGNSDCMLVFEKSASGSATHRPWKCVWPAIG